jgi:hypothetical protein
MKKEEGQITNRLISFEVKGVKNLPQQKAKHKIPFSNKVRNRI